MMICDRNSCTGCGVCAEVCPFHAISMKNDVLGFAYPSIDEGACRHCELCIKKCHILNARVDVSNEHSQPCFYAAWHKNHTIRMASTSGGAFSAFAEVIIKHGGCVVGASFDENYQVSHRGAKSMEELDNLRGSKYVQSSIEQVLPEMEQLLSKERMVFFSGTPCQVSAVNQYFAKHKYCKNLYTVDIVCHGVGSPVFFQKYLSEKLSIMNYKELSSFRFRDKEFSWRNSAVCALFENGKCYRNPILLDPYMAGFNRDVFLRESCYQCKYTSFSRVSDITLSDFWGYIGDALNPDDDMGVSMVMVNSGKGRFLLNEAKENMKLIPETVEDALRGQPCLQKPVERPMKRTEFERDILLPFDRLQNNYLTPWWQYSTSYFYRATHRREVSNKPWRKRAFRYMDAITLRMKWRETVNRWLFDRKMD